MNYINRKRVFFITLAIVCVTGFIRFWVPLGYEAIYEIIWAICSLGVIFVEFTLWRCPHCDSYLFHTSWWADYCPFCGEYMYEDKTWSTDFEKLNYLQGDLRVFEDRCETMLLVTYTDGMIIHVGYDEAETEFVVTALENNTEEAKDHPLAVHRVFGHSSLLTVLQQTIHDLRDDKI